MNTNQLMSRLGLLREFALACAALTVIGCGPPLGSACTTDCPDGYVCVDAAGESNTGRICAQECTTGRDCPVGIHCNLGASFRSHEPGFCDEFGSAPEGALCERALFSPATCGPGLTCGIGVCAPACALNSSHLDDRRCPSGMQCALWYPGGYCVAPPCDVNAPRETQCQNVTDGVGNPLEMLCRRWTNPGLGEGTLCAWVEAARRCEDGTECVVGEVCSGGRCYAQADAPPMTPEQVGVTIPVD